MKKIKNKNIIAIVVVILVVAGIVAAVTMWDTEEDPDPTDPDDEELDVALSLGDYANAWRRQHINIFEQRAAELQAEGIVGEYEVRAAGPGAVTDQAEDIRGLADMGMDVILVNPSSIDGLNSAIEYAVDEGVTVVGTDQHTTSEHSVNVIIDQKEWFADISEWVFEQLDGEGDVVAIEGIPGNPANEERMDGMRETLEDYPDINIIEELTGSWRYDTVQDEYAGVLAEHGGDIDAVLVQDGMIDGVHWAYEEAEYDYDDPVYPEVMTGDHTMRYLREYWLDLKDAGIESYMRANPPGYYADAALQVGVLLAQGEELDTTHPDVDTETFPGTTVWLELGPAITNQNVEDFIEEYRFEDDTYRIDTFMEQEEAEEYFI